MEIKTIYLNRLTAQQLSKIYFIHDGAPPHCTNLVNAFLDDTFQDQWVANNGPFKWPPQSPDMTPMDFFLWGYVKNKVYFHPLTTKLDCQERIRDTFNNLPPEFLQRATTSQVLIRINKCLEVNGRNFEYVL